jgi:hypothetical protein
MINISFVPIPDLKYALKNILIPVVFLQEQVNNVLRRHVMNNTAMAAKLAQISECKSTFMVNVINLSILLALTIAIQVYWRFWRLRFKMMNSSLFVKIQDQRCVH